VATRVQYATSKRFVASSNVTTGTSGTLASAATAGNALILAVSIDKDSGAIATPSGWTALAVQNGLQVSFAVFGKVATGGETSASFSWTTGQQGYATVLAEYSGVSAAPFGSATIPAYSDTAVTSMVIDPPATTAAGTALAFLGIDTAPDATGFQPSATGFSLITSIFDATSGTGQPGLAFMESGALTSGQDLPATTFSWTRSDQVQGTVVLLKNSGATDTTAPTVPTGVTATANSATQVTVSWTASTDAVGVASYRVRRGGVDLTGATAVTGTSFVDTTVSASTAYSYTVSAVDAAGNRSAESTAATVTTPAGGSSGAVTRVQVAKAQYIDTVNPNTAATTSPANPTLAAPATAGNALIAAIAIDKNSGTINTPSGWTLIGQQQGASVSQAIFGKVAAGGETTGPTITWATATPAGYGYILAEYAGVSASPFGPYAATTYSDTAATSMVLDPPAATAAGLGIAVFAIDSAGTEADFQPVGTGFTFVDSTFDTASPSGIPGIALEETAAAVTSGQDIAATTFTWTKNDQVSASAFFLKAGSAPVTPTLLSSVVGIPDSTALRVAARTTQATSVRLQASTSATFASGIVSGSAVAPDARGASQLTVTGLTANTAYYYRVGMTVSGVETFSAISSRAIKVAPSGQASFAFDFGSCTDATDSASMAAIAARNDDLFFHLGDLYYADGSGTGLQNIRDKMTAKIGAANHAAVFSTMPTAYVASDHDGMSNNGNAGSDATAWANWNTAYREHFPTPALPTGGAYYTFTWGRVRFVATDRRSFATAPSATDNSAKTSLGTTQKQWLKDTITAATEPVIVIIQDAPWIGSAIAGDDGWLGYTTERSELASFFAASGKKIVMLAGDMHALAADDGTNAPGGIALFHAAPLNNTASQKGGPYTAGPYPTTGAAVQQYGRCVITDSGSSIALAFTGYSSDNTARVTLTKTYTLSAPTLDKLRLGAGTVGLRVGANTPAKAYLGATQVWP
jgi:alkaline phosphatase D